MHVLIKVNHLETSELSRHILDLLFFIGWNLLNAWSIPFDKGSWGFLVLTTSFDSPIGKLAIVYVLDPVEAHWARFDICFAHVACF